MQREARLARFIDIRRRLRDRLGVDHPEPQWWVWVVALGLGAIAAALRFLNLANPGKLVFDETYYVKQAYSFLLTGGVEWQWSNETTPSADARFTQGTLDVFTRQPDFVVHPPLGKWMIAAGMSLSDPAQSESWRIASAVCGSLMVFILVFVARRLFNSTLLGGVAGLLLAVDGHHLVHSRTGLLDIFLAFWILVAFAFLLADRFWMRARLADTLARRISRDPDSRSRQLYWGPVTWFRPWLLATGIALGCATAVKWSGLWTIIAFGLLVVAWDIGARRAAGVRRWLFGGFYRDAPIAFLHLVPVAFVTYLLSWIGWFRSTDGYNRYWAADNPDSIWTRLLPDSFASLAHYHQQIYDFHRGLATPHDYMANPWSWIVMGRPTSFFYESPSLGQLGCEVDKCSRAITSVGNPVVWWGGAIAIVVTLVVWLVRRDWRAGALLVPLAAGWLPWFAFQERTVYTFYAVAFVPYVVLALTYALGLVMGRPDADAIRRSWGASVAGIVVILAVGCLVFFYPVWTAEVIPYGQWQLRMWWPSWI